MPSSLRQEGSVILRNFIPKLYSSKLLIKFHEPAIISELFNTEDGRALKQMGDTIYIRKRPDVNVKPWKDGTTIDFPDVPQESIAMTVDEAFYWSFKTTHLTIKQSDIKDLTNQRHEEAAQSMRETIERRCFAKVIGSDMIEGNFGENAGIESGRYNLGTFEEPVVITRDGANGTTAAPDYIANMMSVLEEQKISTVDDQFSFVAPRPYKNVLSTGELRRADIMGNTEKATMLKGSKAIGMIQGAKVFSTGYMSPSKNTDGDIVFPVMLLTKRAVSYVIQFTETDSGRLQNEFADYYKGLAVFGVKVVEPKAIALGFVKFNAA